MKRYEQIPHTADIAAKIYGRTLPELFQNAAYAMFDMMGDLEGLGLDMTVRVKTQALDSEGLLVSWLNELLYLAYSRQALFSDFSVTSLGENELRGEARGQELKDYAKHIRTEIKAATYHDLEIKRTDQGYEIVIVFDV
jgi:SHS2 domain-containing protein